MKSAAATRDDEGLETVRPQVTQEFLHRLIGELVVGLVEARVFGGSEPRLHSGVELLGRHPDMGEGKDPHQAVVMWPFEEFGDVASKGRLHHGVGGELGLVRRASLELVKDERHLKRHGDFRPERAIVVEDGDTLGRRDEIGRAFLGDLLDEGDDGLLRCRVIPRGQWVGSEGDGWGESRGVNERGGQ